MRIDTFVKVDIIVKLFIFRTCREAAIYFLSEFPHLEGWHSFGLESVNIYET